MTNPLVTVICVCYNHARFVEEALNSVKSQSYSNIEIIIINDGSKDNSASLIDSWVAKNPVASFINLRENQGYCKAFNKALKKATGEFIIDFATDDLMPPTKIGEQIDFFRTQNENVGVVFTDADYIDQDGNLIRSHFSYLSEKKLVTKVPEGDVYSDVLSKYFIPSPTMMSRAKVFQALNGYDEQLAYEDFDFWVRSARTFHYAYLPKKLMKIRRNIDSMSTRLYKSGDLQLHSTYLVCLKAMNLNQNEQENMALVKRVQYELRQSVLTENINEAKLFLTLLKKLNGLNLFHRLIFSLGKFGLPLSPVRRLYHKLWYQSF